MKFLSTVVALVNVTLLSACQTRPPLPVLQMKRGQTVAVMPLIENQVVFYDKGYIYDDAGVHTVDWGIDQWVSDAAIKALQPEFPAQRLEPEDPLFQQVISYLKSDGTYTKPGTPETIAGEYFDYVVLIATSKCQAGGGAVYYGTGAAYIPPNVYLGMGVFQAGGVMGSSNQNAYACLVIQFIDARTFQEFRGSLAEDVSGNMPVRARSDQTALLGGGAKTEDTKNPSPEVMAWLKSVLKPMIDESVIRTVRQMAGN